LPHVTFIDLVADDDGNSTDAGWTRHCPSHEVCSLIGAGQLNVRNGVIDETLVQSVP
jgi:hypothetical protein